MASSHRARRTDSVRGRATGPTRRAPGAGTWRSAIGLKSGRGREQAGLVGRSTFRTQLPQDCREVRPSISKQLYGLSNLSGITMY